MVPTTSYGYLNWIKHIFFIDHCDCHVGYLLYLYLLKTMGFSRPIRPIVSCQVYI